MIKKKRILILAGALFGLGLISCEKELHRFPGLEPEAALPTDELKPMLGHYSVALENTGSGNLLVHKINPYNGNKTIKSVGIVPMRTCSSGLPKPPSNIRHGQAVAIASDGELYVSGHTITGSMNGPQSIFVGGINDGGSIKVAPIDIITGVSLGSANVQAPFLFDAYVPGSSTNGNPIVDIEVSSEIILEEPGVQYILNDVLGVLQNGDIFGYRSNNQHTLCHDVSELGYQEADFLGNVKTGNGLSGSKFKIAVKYGYLYALDSLGKVVKYKIKASGGFGNPTLGARVPVGNIGTVLNGSCGSQDHFAMLMTRDAYTHEIESMFVNHTACTFQNYNEYWRQVNANANGLDPGGSSNIAKIYDVGYAPR